MNRQGIDHQEGGFGLSKSFLDKPKHRARRGRQNTTVWCFGPGERGEGYAVNRPASGTMTQVAWASSKREAFATSHARQQ
jgi:hypothetical protein